MEVLHCIEVNLKSLIACTLALCAGHFLSALYSKQCLCCQNISFPSLTLSPLNISLFLNDRVSEFDGYAIVSAHCVTCIPFTISLTR